MKYPLILVASFWASSANADCSLFAGEPAAKLDDYTCGVVMALESYVYVHSDAPTNQRMCFRDALGREFLKKSAMHMLFDQVDAIRIRAADSCGIKVPK